MSLITDYHSFTNWLNGSFLQLNISANTKGHYAWRTNDWSLKAFMLQHISPTDYKLVASLPTCATVFEALHKCHENLGPLAQILLIFKVFATCFHPGVMMTKVIKEIDSLHTRILAMGPLEGNHLCTVLLLNALGEHYPHLQSFIRTSNNPSFLSNTVVTAIQNEEELIHLREEQGLQAPSTALAAQSCPCGKVIYAHCKWPGHLVDYCIQPGGKMEGHSVEEA
jgi:hypothetical protein